MQHPVYIWANIIGSADGLPLNGEWNYCDTNNPEDAQYIRMDEHERLMNPDTKAMMDTIGRLLSMIDGMLEGDGISLHTYGQTPDWYVEAAYLSCYGRLPTSPSSEEASTS